MTNAFTVVYARLRHHIWAMIVVPLIPMGIFVSAILQFPNVAEWVIYVGVIASMAIAIFSLRWLIKQHLSVEAHVVPKDNGLEIELIKTNLFYPNGEIFLSFPAIRNISYNYQAQNNQEYLLVKLAKGPNVQFLPSGNKPEDLPALCDSIYEKRNQYNSNPALQQKDYIGNTGFYETAFAKVLTVTSLIATGMVTVVMIVRPGLLHWYKAIGWYAIAATWLINVWNAKQKSNQNKN